MRNVTAGKLNLAANKIGVVYIDTSAVDPYDECHIDTPSVRCCLGRDALCFPLSTWKTNHEQTRCTAAELWLMVKADITSLAKLASSYRVVPHVFLCKY